MVCANPDLFATEGNPPRPVVRQGGIAKLYEELGGRVIYIGKPYSAAYQMAMSYFQGQKPGNVLMVGDTPETDIRGARSIGMGTALTTKTGVMSERIAKHGLAQAIQALPEGDTPDFYIEQLGSP
jgi:ribonucleotide monophosphatase NagD (HAD superfamily)